MKSLAYLLNCKKVQSSLQRVFLFNSTILRQHATQMNQSKTCFTFHTFVTPFFKQSRVNLSNFNITIQCTDSIAIHVVPKANHASWCRLLQPSAFKTRQIPRITVRSLYIHIVTECSALGKWRERKKFFNDSSKLTIFLQLSLRTNTHTEFFTLLMAAAGRMLFTYEPIIRRSAHYRILGRAWDHEIHNKVSGSSLR